MRIQMRSAYAAGIVLTRLEERSAFSGGSRRCATKLCGLSLGLGCTMRRREQSCAGSSVHVKGC